MTLQLDLFLIYSACQLNVNTKKIEHKTKKKSFSVYRLWTSCLVHKTSPHNESDTVTNHECPHQKRRCPSGLPDLFKSRHIVMNNTDAGQKTTWWHAGCCHHYHHDCFSHHNCDLTPASLISSNSSHKESNRNQLQHCQAPRSQPLRFITPLHCNLSTSSHNSRPSLSTPSRDTTTDLTVHYRPSLLVITMTPFPWYNIQLKSNWNISLDLLQAY